MLLRSSLRNIAPPARLRSLASLPDTSGIPVIDFTNANANSRSAKLLVAHQLIKGFKEMGFVYLGGHGIEDKVVKQAFQKSGEFFSLPSYIKSQLAWEDPRSNRGYVQAGRERVTTVDQAAEIAALRLSAPDCKESMELGRDWDSQWKNMWPSEADAPGFKAFFLNFFQDCHELHVQVMRSIALGLGLEETFFDDNIQAQDHNLRLLSYPPIKADIFNREDQARAGAHTDYGTLTLLFQDSVGGLQVQNPISKEFRPAPPIPGTIVINTADLLARWSNDTLRSTLHRVVAPTTTTTSTSTDDTLPKRQSIAFFCNPNFDAEISCLPDCHGPHMPMKYPPIKTADYIVRRLRETYT